MVWLASSGLKLTVSDAFFDPHIFFTGCGSIATTVNITEQSVNFKTHEIPTKIFLHREISPQNLELIQTLCY